jgi:hypothetical protein
MKTIDYSIQSSDKHRNGIANGAAVSEKGDNL